MFLLADAHPAVSTVLFGRFVRARFWHADKPVITKGVPRVHSCHTSSYSTGKCSFLILLFLEDLNRIVTPDELCTVVADTPLRYTQSESFATIRNLLLYCWMYSENTKNGHESYGCSSAVLSYCLVQMCRNFRFICFLNLLIVSLEFKVFPVTMVKSLAIITCLPLTNGLVLEYTPIIVLRN